MSSSAYQGFVLRDLVVPTLDDEKVEMKPIPRAVVLVDGSGEAPRTVRHRFLLGVYEGQDEEITRLTTVELLPTEIKKDPHCKPKTKQELKSAFVKIFEPLQVDEMFEYAKFWPKLDNPAEHVGRPVAVFTDLDSKVRATMTVKIISDTSNLDATDLVKIHKEDCMRALPDKFSSYVIPHACLITEDLQLYGVWNPQFARGVEFSLSPRGQRRLKRMVQTTIEESIDRITPYRMNDEGFRDGGYDEPGFMEVESGFVPEEDLVD